MTKHSRSPLLSLFITIFIDMMGVGIAIPVLATVLIQPNAGIVSATMPLATRTLLYGLLVMVFPLAQFFGAPLLGALSDRHGRRGLLALSLSGTFVGYILFALGLIFHNLPLLFLSRGVAGFMGGNIAIAQSAIADVSDAKSRVRNFGLVGMAFGLGFTLGPFIGGKLADPTVLHWFTFSTPFWFAAILTAINIFLVLTTLQETLTVRRATPVDALTGFRNVFKAFSMKHLRAMLLVIFLWTLGLNFFFQFFQVFLIEKFTFSQGDIGNIFAFIGFFAALTQGVLTRPVSKYFSSAQILKVSLLMLGLIVPLLLIPHAVWMLYVINGFFAIFQGLTFPNTTTMISNLSDRASQGEAMGISQSVQSFAMIIPPVIAGIIGGINIALPFLVGSVFLLLAWGVFMGNFRKPTREKFHEV